MEVKFVVVGGNNSGKEIPVSGPKFLIGRSEECQLRPKSDLVSRHHAVVLLDEGYAAIRDFGSKNGTFVNGERVLAEHELKNGDRLKVGPLEFEVQLVVHVGGKKKPKIHSIQEAAARTVETAVQTAGDDDDMDVGDWLTDDEEAVAATRSHDTQELSAGETSIGTAAPVPAPKPDAPAESVPAMPQGKSKAEQEKEEKEKAKAEKLKRLKKLMAEDTQTAADDTLRKLFDRRM
ncbi:MAG TPA: FHA domain-containing protein [Thermoguttaceae bacterium]|nr:FHA domain-containing protein [Thermoguttaceae bacterium]